MAQGYYGTESNPLAHLYSEQIVFTEHTSDPAGVQQGDMWLRTDLNSGDKEATMRWYNSNGIQDVPLFAEAETPDSDIVKVVPVQTTAGELFMPYYEGGGAFKEQAIQHGGARHGLHNSLTAIPDSGISRWEYEQDVTDSWGSNDGTDNTSAGFTTNAAEGTYAKSLDGADDVVNFGTPTTLNNLWSGGGSLATWFKHDGTGQYMFSKADGTNGWIVYTLDSDGSVRLLTYWDSSASWRTVSGVYSTGSWTHIVITYNSDSTSNSPTIYIDGSSVSFQSTGSPSGSNGDDSAIDWLAGEYNGNFWGGDQDDTRTYSKELSSSEVSSLYNNGHI